MLEAETEADRIRQQRQAAGTTPGDETYVTDEPEDDVAAVRRRAREEANRRIAESQKV